jgi:non-specific serine/threonine protein kinase/serine/threonine-protein kinase
MAESITKRARRVFMELADLPPEAQAAGLAAACGGDAQLLAEVQALLEADARAGGFMGAPTSDVPPNFDAEARIAPSVREVAGTRIGPYKLLQLIGEGGFGSVFMAEQERPVARKVALKIIKLGMDTRQVVARFEQERQALAILDHPNIAKVLDAGATETGRPFFVMELVKGEPIAEYADKHSMSIRDRLELFAQVCNAVQHAHTKGIIHRDIKPSNVLVSTQDGRPHAKVIDFGIAKATASKLTEKTLFTEHRQLIGTPEYMSPEQAEGSLDIDTRTDVYSLGVLLYELLTGTTPFSSQELRSAAYAEIQRIIREVEPPRPSTRLSSNTETLASVAAKRSAEPKRLGLTIQGELDWIVMKALEKDRQRRYESPSSLAADIQRHLGGEAVVAAPPSTGYRLRKFIRRNRAPVLAGGAVGAALVLGIVGTSIGMWQAVNARAAERVRAEGEAAAKQQAERRLQQVETANELLASIFSDLRPDKIAESGRPLQVVLADRISGAMEQLQGDATGDPLTVAKLQTSFGNSLAALSQSAKAVSLLERALDTRTKALGADDPLTLKSANDLVKALGEAREYARAEALARDVIRRAGDSNDEQVRRRKLVAMRSLPTLLFRQGKEGEALAMGREVVEATRALDGPDAEDTAIAINSLGFMHQQFGEGEEAVKLFEEASRIFALTLPPEHPTRLALLNNLASAHWSMGKLDRSIPIFEELQSRQLDSLGPDHINTRMTSANLGVNYASAGRYEEAIVRLELACNAALKNPQLNFVAIPLLQCYFKAGRMDSAQSFASRLLALFKATEKPTSPVLSDWLANAASAYVDAGMTAEAEPFIRELDAMSAPELWRSARSRSWLAENLAGAAAERADAPIEQRVDLMNEAERLVMIAIEQTQPGTEGADGEPARVERAEYHRSAIVRAALIFKARHRLEPGKGYDERAAEWNTKARALEGGTTK